MDKPPALGDGRYRVLRRIGDGAHATVWEATELATGESVAVKVLRDEVLGLEDVQRLAQEVEILRQLQHPGIVKLHGTGVTREGSPYVVMELLDGLSLREVLHERGLLPHAEVRHILSQVCCALVEAHKAGVVHRDVKPENVLLSGHDRRTAKLVDFGTAKRLDPHAPVLTFDNKILGTPHYMAPERAMGRPVGGAADVYAVAVMAYEMLSGRLPFEGKSALQVLTQHIKTPPPPMPGVAREVEQAVSWGLTKDPRHRPSAEQFAERLCQALDAE
jgi:serine/threonine-protein kinase